MTKPDDPDDAVKALYRMIAYIRDEATRLRLAEVALLLARADEAGMVCKASGAGDYGLDSAFDPQLRRH